MEMSPQVEQYHKESIELNYSGDKFLSKKCWFVIICPVSEGMVGHDCNRSIWETEAEGLLQV